MSFYMLHSKKIHSLSLIAVLSLATYTSLQPNHVTAEQSQKTSTVHMSQKTIEHKLKVADKEAAPLYAKIDHIQRHIEVKKAKDLKVIELYINKDINQLEKQNKRLLTKFYTSIDNQTWDSTSEVKKLIDKTNLSTNEKDRLKLYFEQRAYLETRLNDRYQKFDNSIENQNKELKILTSKIEKIYQKHGITKEVLKTYYAKKQYDLTDLAKNRKIPKVYELLGFYTRKYHYF